jgi:hypothetical protein
VEDMFDQCQSEICKSRQYINDILDEININHDRNMFIFATIRHIIAIQNLSRSMMKITIFEYKNELTRMFKNQKDAREFNSKLSQYNTAIMDSDNSCRIF